MSQCLESIAGYCSGFGAWAGCACDRTSLKCQEAVQCSDFGEDLTLHLGNTIETYAAATSNLGTVYSPLTQALSTL